MSYRIKGKNGLPIKKDGQFLLGFDIPTTKIEQLNESEMSFLAVGSTEDEDRDKDIVRVSGWKLDNFKSNPVLPWSHNYWEPPVGKAVSIRKDNTKKKLIFKAQFDKEDDKARLIFNKYKNGFLNTFSVGFIGLESKMRVEGDYWGGREFTKQELLEISPVTVPSNPNANMDIRGICDDLPPTLEQMGFKRFTCKTDSGLFVPVVDTELFTSPFTVSQENGIKSMYASLIDNPESTEKQLVGYIFSDDVEKDEAEMYTSEHLPKKSIVKYFDMGSKTIGDFEFDLEIVEEAIEGTDSEEKKPSSTMPCEEVDDSMECSEDDVEEAGCGGKRKPKKDGDVEEDAIDEDTVEEDSVDEDSVEEEGLDDSEEAGCGGKRKPKKDGNVEENKSSVTEIKLSEEQLSRIVEAVKKAVVNDKEIDNNSDNDSAVELSEETGESKSGDIIEFDPSLFSPVNEEKDLESVIEIDEAVFQEVKSQIKAKKLNVGASNLREVLEKSIREALNDFSGKLED